MVILLLDIYIDVLFDKIMLNCFTKFQHDIAWHGWSNVFIRPQVVDTIVLEICHSNIM